MFSSDQLALILVALAIVGLTLAGMLAVVLAAGRRSHAARAAAPRPRGTPADFALPLEPRASIAPAAPAGPASPPTTAAYAAAEASAPPSPMLAFAPPEAPVFDPTMPLPARPGQAQTDSSAGAAPAVPPAAEVERERRFTFDMRAHDPRADEAIAGYLGLDPAGRREAGPPLDPLVDPATGLDTLLAWERMLAEESHRYARYRRPVSVVVAELDGLARLVDRVGAEAARRVLPAVGDALRRHARRTDRVAHAGGGRFLMLLPETDEIQAINYVERVRVACERWLEAGAVALRLSVGWASPTGVGDLETAVRTAEDRMYAERHRGNPSAAPSDSIS